MADRAAGQSPLRAATPTQSDAFPRPETSTEASNLSDAKRLAAETAPTKFGSEIDDCTPPQRSGDGRGSLRVPCVGHLDIPGRDSHRAARRATLGGNRLRGTRMNDATRTAQPLQGEAALIRAVGTFALTAAVINVIVGGGIFRMPSALSAQMGAAAPLSLVAGALAIIPIALCFAAVGSRVQVTGGPYSYLAATLGPFAGFLAGALMWISNFTSSAAVASALSVQVANLVPALAAPLSRAVLITAVYVALFALNAFGVKMGARAITALAALKLTPLFLLAAVGVFFVDWTLVSFSPAAVPSLSALGASMALVMFAYSGMETALVPSGEVQDPARSVPRAAIAAILLVVLLYLGLQIVGQGVLGARLATSGAPVAETAAAIWGSNGRTLLLATA
ncbi:MAG TPA: APC family permease, partial [Lysobacter sp.]|nr:APC family permease [Lysobacter sp.]